MSFGMNPLAGAQSNMSQAALNNSLQAQGYRDVAQRPDTKVFAVASAIEHRLTRLVEMHKAQIARIDGAMPAGETASLNTPHPAASVTHALDRAAALLTELENLAEHSAALI